MRIMGLDEAGRGAVLGPLVVGAFILEEERLGDVSATGATDSKKLSAKKRVRIAGDLESLGVHGLRDISAPAIDAENINTLEERAFASLIAEHRPDRVIIDAPCHPAAIPAFCQRLLERLDYCPELVVEPKADLNYPPCSAASIFAKVHRDQCIKALGAVGSGYPSDPVTRRWLQEQIDEGGPLPSFVRQRWGTVAALSQGRLFR